MRPDLNDPRGWLLADPFTWVTDGFLQRQGRRLPRRREGSILSQCNPPSLSCEIPLSCVQTRRRPDRKRANQWLEDQYCTDGTRDDIRRLVLRRALRGSAMKKKHLHLPVHMAGVRVNRHEWVDLAVDFVRYWSRQPADPDLLNRHAIMARSPGWSADTGWRCTRLRISGDEKRLLACFDLV